MGPQGSARLSNHNYKISSLGRLQQDMLHWVKHYEGPENFAAVCKRRYVGTMFFWTPTQEEAVRLYELKQTLDA